MEDNNYDFKTIFDNDAFFELAISKERAYGKKLQATINYNLNIEGHDRNQTLFNLIRNNISLFSKNLRRNYEKLKEGNFSKIIDQVVERWNLNDLSEDESYKIYMKNRDYFDKYFNYYHNGWMYLVSTKTNPALNDVIKKEDVVERLYISINSSQIDNFCREFQTILDRENIPYNFKLQPGTLKSADTVCIYSDSTERSKQYIDILLSLINNNKDYQDAIHIPQPHLGIINNLIGYGIEPKNGDSYSEIVEKIILKTIELTCAEIYEQEAGENHRNPNTTMRLKKEEGQLNSYILELVQSHCSIHLYYDFKECFIKNFILISENDYPNIDFDMTEMKNKLIGSKKQIK